MQRAATAALLGAALLLVSGHLHLPVAGGTAQAAAQRGEIPDQYIVVLRDDVPDPRAVAQEHANAHAITVLHVYEHSIKGYAARIPAASVEPVWNFGWDESSA